MKVSLVIPTYWGRAGEIGWQQGDAVYDHPTPVNEEGTFLRTISSLDILEDKNFQLIILAAATTPDIQLEMEEKLRRVLSRLKKDFNIFFFSHSHLQKVSNFFEEKGKPKFVPFLKLRGYSNIRNICLFVAHLLGSEVVVLIDDDELVEDPEFLTKAREHIGQNINGKPVNAVAGYYINPDGHYLLNREVLPWMGYWNKIGWMNEAFREFIGKPPRLKETPFVFGGNMVLHRDLFTLVPFDPNVTRGEDIDYLINAKMFGLSFWLDNELSIKHDPPPKTHPKWKQIREDIYRFVFSRAKLLAQKEMPGMRRVTPEELGPYPGKFLKGNLQDMIFKSNTMLAFDYLAKRDQQGVEECMRNIYLAQYDAPPKFDPFQRLLELQKQWASLMGYVGDPRISAQLREIVGFYE